MGRDIHVEVKIGNILNMSGDIVIPSNTTFDTSFEQDIISLNSIQGQFTKKYFSDNIKQLDEKINTSLNDKKNKNTDKEYVKDKKKGKKYKYDYGTTIKLELTDKKVAYFVAISEMNNDCVASTDSEKLLESLLKLWDTIANKGSKNTINIPLIGTGCGRITEGREVIAKLIVDSLITALSTGNSFLSQLNIIIYPNDLLLHEIDVNGLCDFIKFHCDNFEYNSTNKKIGTGII